MDTETELTESLRCSETVVVRWDSRDSSPEDVLQFLEDSGYKIVDEKQKHISSDTYACLFLILSSESETIRLCEDSSKSSLKVNESNLRINRLIEPNGVRLRDAIDFMRTHHHDPEHDIDLLLGLTRSELPERDLIAKSEYGLIAKEVGRLVENGKCITFGSFSSPIRRNGYSDIDFCVESVDNTGIDETKSVRPLQEIIENPKCLLSSPLTRSEFYTYPAEVVIKGLAHCFQDNEQLKEKFQIRAALARTPIIIFKSHTNGIEMSYDLSVNNLISVQKTEVLNLFITRDISGKTRKVLMFIVFWAKTNRLINGTYPEERLEVKTGLWSYIINQLVIHFIQVVADKQLINPDEEGNNRVMEYNFSEIFEDYTSFFLQFFQYYADFDYGNNAIHGKQVIKKNDLDGFERTPFMLIDQMDQSHNVTSKTTKKALEQLKELCRNAAFILEKEKFRVDLLLQTNQSASELRK